MVPLRGDMHSSRIRAESPGDSMVKGDGGWDGGWVPLGRRRLEEFCG